MKEKIAVILEKPTGLKKEEILQALEIPKDSALGDCAFPCFSLAKVLKKSPMEIAKSLASNIKSTDFEKIEAVGPYINFFVNRNFLAAEVLKKIQKEGDKYGSSSIGKGKSIVIDMSSPNVAKPFGIGHLRSTIIGNSIAKISTFLGFKVIKINYLGDWGTQFGKLIIGYKKFGSPEKLKKDPIKNLQEWYVQVNKDESLEPEAREWFKKLEEGDKEALKLWKLFREVSLKKFDEIYKLLGIKFEVISGESLYNKMEKTLDLLKEKGLLKKAQGAEIVDLTEYALGACLIRKSDGATLYATRDLTAAIERFQDYHFHKMIYEVGSEQKLHFKQVFKVLSLLGFNWAENCIHADHGLYLDSDGKKFATRKGKTVFMEDVLEETIALAKQEIEKREKLAKKEIERRAKAIALSAIFYGDLKNYRSNSIIFDIDKFLSFEGDTGPYLLYTYARARSILRKAKYKKGRYSINELTDLEKQLINQLSSFPEIAKHAYENLAPNIIANYSFQLAQLFNEFYHKNQVIGSENEKFKLALVDSFSQVLKNSLALLGISTLERM